MADYRSYFDRDYIGSWDLNGKDAVVKIRSVQAGVLTSQGNRKTKKPVLHFEGKEKGLALNKTNAKTIAAMYGNDTEKWVGKSIAIYPTTTSFGSETVDCIRVRPGVPSGQRTQRSEPREPSINWRDALGLGPDATAADVEDAHHRLCDEWQDNEAKLALFNHARGFALKELGDG